MAFFNAKGEQIVELHVNTPSVHKAYVLYFDPVEDKDIIKIIEKTPDLSVRMKEKLLNQMPPW